MHLHNQLIYLKLCFTLDAFYLAFFKIKEDIFHEQIQPTVLAFKKGSEKVRNG